jgi:hypothetical protein
VPIGCGIIQSLPRAAGCYAITTQFLRELHVAFAVTGEQLEHVVDISRYISIRCRLGLNHLSNFEFVGRHIALLLLALRSRADSVAHIPKFFWPFEEPPFSALPLFIRSRWIKKPVQLRRRQVESRRSSFLGAQLGRLRYCERLLEKTANGFRTGQLSILTRTRTPAATTGPTPSRVPEVAASI